MSAKIPKLIDLILCDEIRREDNGKLLVLGMYLGTILAPRIPFRMPSLTFFSKWKPHGPLNGEFRLTNPAKEPLGSVQLGADGDTPSGTGLFYLSFTLNNIQLTETGTYTLSYKPPQGKRFRPIFTFEVGIKDEAATSRE